MWFMVIHPITGNLTMGIKLVKSLLLNWWPSPTIGIQSNFRLQACGRKSMSTLTGPKHSWRLPMRSNLHNKWTCIEKSTFDHGAYVNVCIHHITSHHITLHYITLHYKQKTYAYIYIYLQLHSTPHSLQVQKVPRFCTALHPGGPESRDDFPLPSSLRKGGWWDLIGTKHKQLGI